MLQNRYVYLNGDFLPWEQATVHMLSHSLSRGSAIFEVLSFHETDAGPAIFRLDKHIDRLFKSAEFLDMDLPLSGEALTEIVLNTVRKNGIREGEIKIMGYYPQITFGLLPPQRTIDIAVFAVSQEEYLNGPGISAQQGASLCISKWCKLDPRTVPIEAKAAANYLNGMMAGKDALSRGFDMGVMLDTQGFVAEGGADSIFLVKDNRLMTPSEGTILKSITRMSIIQAAKILDIECREARLSPDHLLNADEGFLSCTPVKIMPVRQLEGRRFSQVPGPVTSTISKLLGDIVAGRDERFRSWLFPLNEG